MDFAIFPLRMPCSHLCKQTFDNNLSLSIGFDTVNLRVGLDCETIVSDHTQ